MVNMKYVLLGRKLHIEVDLGAVVQDTKNGNKVVATTENWQRLPDVPGYSINAVVVRRPDAKVPDSALQEE